MGNIKVLVTDRETVNIDKICRIALEIAHVRKLPPGDIVVVSGGDHDIDIEGDPVDRDYRKRGGRSLTETYALRAGLGTADASGFVCVESPIVGLVSLCQSLAENNNKVPGVQPGALYRKGMITAFAKELATLPEHATEIVDRLVKAIIASLGLRHPTAAYMAAGAKEWNGLSDALAAAGRADYDKARDMVRALQEGRYADGSTFPLAMATGQYAPQGIALQTRNPNLMKHAWGVIKSKGTVFMVATAVVSHPDTKRIAVLSSTQYPVDVTAVAKALKKRFKKAEFDVNVERGSIIWDPRTQDAHGPTPDEMQEIVSKHLAFKKDEQAVQTPGLGATFGDAFRLKARQRNR